ncbi:MAG: hypothetical protein RLZZ366_924 [Pseudomonadota bacterium]|jgi:aryl-alcohol dehydrogenase-like predicted oxidoreductase
MGARGNCYQVIIATKVGLPMGKDRRGMSRGCSTQVVEASLGRLQTDYIDLYEAHREDTFEIIHSAMR